MKKLTKTHREKARTMSEIRVSPDGKNVAIRNNSLPLVSSAPWRVSNGGFYSDEQVADWYPLVPKHAIVRATERLRDLLVANGICSCGNRFSGDNLCMPNACQMEEFKS
jgi:hypothetical protein